MHRQLMVAISQGRKQYFFLICIVSLRRYGVEERWYPDAPAPREKAEAIAGLTVAPFWKQIYSPLKSPSALLSKIGGRKLRQPALAPYQVKHSRVHGKPLLSDTIPLGRFCLVMSSSFLINGRCPTRCFVLRCEPAKERAPFL